MQARSHLHAVAVSPAEAVGLSAGPAGYAPGARRNSMADRPQDFCGRLRPAVRPIQHLNPRFVDATIAPGARSVTRTDQRNVLRT